MSTANDWAAIFVHNNVSIWKKKPSGEAGTNPTSHQLATRKIAPKNSRNGMYTVVTATTYDAPRYAPRLYSRWKISRSARKMGSASKDVYMKKAT